MMIVIRLIVALMLLLMAITLIIVTSLIVSPSLIITAPITPIESSSPSTLIKISAIGEAPLMLIHLVRLILINAILGAFHTFSLFLGAVIGAT